MPLFLLHHRIKGLFHVRPPDFHIPPNAGPEAEALEAQAAEAEAAGLEAGPHVPRTYKRKKGYALLGDGETVGPSSEPLSSVRQRRNPVRISYAEDDDGAELEYSAKTWSRKPRQQREWADWNSDPSLDGAENGGEATTMREPRVGGLPNLDISRFFQESPKVLEWIKGECEHNLNLAL